LNSFPIEEVLSELKEQLIHHPIVVLQAPPGAGKSTILPVSLLNETWLTGKKILMLEPRRLAARAVAARMADLLQDQLGNRVGYKVRFENRTSSNTQIEVVTEGILIRMLQDAAVLEETGLIIFDEFHERSLNTDVSLALCLQVQKILREDLRILIMSATLDGASLESTLPKAPVIISEGRHFPVKIIYLNTNPDEHLSSRMVSAIKQALKEQSGDILAFHPGAGEILKTASLLNLPEHFVVHLLYGDLPLNKQQEALLPDSKGRRKIILATSIAETSLTIEGVSIVVDSGYARIPRFDPRRGLSSLETTRITQDAATQRAGRAGRLGPGCCYRLWNEGLHNNLLPHRDPEILDSDLSSMILELCHWGIKDIKDLSWITIPPAGAVAQAKELLQKLGAIKDEVITERGKEILKLPTHPRIGHLVLEARDLDKINNNVNYTALATDLAAFLEEKDPLPKGSGVDISLRIELLRKFRRKEFIPGERGAMERIEKIALQWRKLFKIPEDNSNPIEEEIGKLLSVAYPERIARLIDPKNSRYRLANGRMVKLPPNDILTGKEWLVIANMDGGATEGKIYLAASLDQQDVMHLAEDHDIVTWDSQKGMLVSLTEKRIGNITIGSKSLGNIPEAQRVSILIEAIRQEGLDLLFWDVEQNSWQSRVQCIKVWRTEEGWPDVSNKALLNTLEVWLAPYLINVAKQADFKQLDIHFILKNILSFEQQQNLEKFAPAKLKVPSGSMVSLNYYADGSPPEMAVRLQEVFGLTETPKVNEGRNKIVMHLLSPAYRPVQVTQDLNSFWKNTYPSVRKELRIKYQKHHWPEDPWTAEAVHGTKRNLKRPT
jgi:ATP-dependent helicase HrpB